MTSLLSNTVQPITMKIGMHISPSGGAEEYQLLHRSINRQVANMVAENDTNLVQSLTFRYDSVESPL
ncbi:UNVERIFIED_CONTAM: hypothetical protein NCL1_04718 [Trichonephila clavipes]